MLSVGALLVFALLLSGAVNLVEVYDLAVADAKEKARGLTEIIEAVDGFVARIPKEVEGVVGKQMVVQALLASHLVAVAEGKAKMTPEQITALLRDVVKRSAVDEFWITDSKGHAYLHSAPGVDFTFPANPTPKDQAYHFRKLLDRPDGRFVQESREREIDKEVFKYVGVSGVDKPRIVQVGFNTKSLRDLTAGLSRGALLKAAVGKAGAARYRVVRPDGAVRIDVEPGKPVRHDGRVKDEALLALVREALATGKVESRLSGGRLDVAAPLSMDGSTAALLGRFDASRVWWTMRRAALYTGIAALVALLVAGLFLSRLARGVADPIAGLSGAAGRIAEGDLAAARESLGRLTESVGRRGAREIVRLLRAVTEMADRLNGLVSQVQRAGITVTTSSTEISASARELEASGAQQAASTNQVAASAREINQTSEGLAENMAHVAGAASEAASLAEAGQADLVRLGDTMRRFTEATRSITARLSDIHEKTDAIGAVTTAIDKVAEQTNLLSLNAAIEAEKAGEYGQGFSVVAREIRRLADRTAIATLEIESVVKEMQAAVSAGVMEMDRFRQEMRQGVEEAAGISEQLAGVIGRVQGLTPRIEAVNDGMQTQSGHARQITDAMVQLGEGARQAAESLREFSRVTAELNDAANGLREGVSRFNVSEG